MTLKTDTSPAGLYLDLKERLDRARTAFQKGVPCGRVITWWVHEDYFLLIEHYRGQALLLREILQKMQPMELMQGDVYNHHNPGSSLKCNTSTSWLVTKDESSAYKSKKFLEDIMLALEATAPEKWMENAP